ncbi:Zinc finger and BTB domain-containing protein 14, partial [Toxocara canis]
SCGTSLRISVETQEAKQCKGILTSVVKLPCNQTKSGSSIESRISSGSPGGSPSVKKDNHFICQPCKKHFTTHTSLHAHIAVEHGKDTEAFVKCSQCGADPRILWHSSVCHLCGEFTSNLNDHEAIHYRDKEGINALFECSKCFRSFSRFNELKKHLVNDHRRKRVLPKPVRCAVCSVKFYSRHARDQHFVSHFKSVFEDLWQTICDMHESFGELLQRSECPLCEHIMASKKSLRRHVISQHLLQIIGSSRALFDELRTVKRERPDGVQHSSGAINLSRQMVDGNEQHRKGSMAVERNVRNEVSCGVENADIKESGYSVVHGQRQIVPSDGDSSLTAENESAERRKLVALESGCEKEYQAEMIDIDPATRNAVGFCKNGTDSSICRPQLNEPTFSASSRSHGEEASSGRESNCIQGALNTHSDDAMDMRERLISFCLDRNAKSPRCIRCEWTFARMFDFEVHLVRTHLSSFFLKI